jgi:hypothetical protein
MNKASLMIYSSTTDRLGKLWNAMNKVQVTKKTRLTLAGW